MYAVIFKAEIREFDDAYSKMAENLKDLAFKKYGCTQFVSVTEGSQEIAISYWKDLESIKQWKQDATHLSAQKLGSKNWYRYYHVQVVEVLREYTSEE